MQAHEAPAVTTSMMAMNEPTVRWDGTACVWQGLSRKPEGAGIEICSIYSHYNSLFAGIGRHDALLAFEQQVLPEDVLR